MQEAEPPYTGYIYYRAKWAMSKHRTRSLGFPSWVTWLMQRIAKQTEKLEQQLQRRPTEGELAEALGMTLEHYQRRRLLVNFGVLVEEEIERPPMLSPQDAAGLAGICHDRLDALLNDTLDARAKQLLELVALEGVSFARAAQILGISKEKARIVYNTALMALRASARSMRVDGCISHDQR
jgi:DNA-directed RNA polymerase specialized sigma subunit